ncbi:non-structural protein 3 [African horse sickness virus 3]|uniref:Non-structural protein NS3 n=2 Tax=African horse sickness virus 3 TaxID=117204 RepID=A0A189RKF5_AHSV3|nr:non-structural protein 3 [African horse sickness virus 3]ALL99300.1 non-structural protein 3 [African horse sickness virus 3]
MSLATIAENYMMHNGNQRAIVPYVPPPYTYANAPTLGGQAGEMESMSLGILNQAMSSTTGASGALKDEKAAFGAMAEALRDPEPIRQIKKTVGLRTLKHLKIELASMRRRYAILRVVIFMSGCVTMATSMVGGLTIIDTEIYKDLNGDGWLSKTVHGLNLLCTTMLLAAGKISDKIQEEISRTKRDIAKRESYVSAASMSWSGDTSVLLKEVKYGDS